MYYGTLTFFYSRHIIIAERKNNSCLNLVSDYPILDVNCQSILFSPGGTACNKVFIDLIERIDINTSKSYLPFHVSYETGIHEHLHWFIQYLEHRLIYRRHQLLLKQLIKTYLSKHSHTKLIGSCLMSLQKLNRILYMPTRKSVAVCFKKLYPLL